MEGNACCSLSLCDRNGSSRPHLKGRSILRHPSLTLQASPRPRLAITVLALLYSLLGFPFDVVLFVMLFYVNCLVRCHALTFLQMVNQPLNTELPEEVKETLDSCQAQIQKMYADAQILKDENHPEADSIYKTYCYLCCLIL